MYGITNLYMIEDYSHYSIVKDLLRPYWCVRKDAQNSTLNLKEPLCLSAQLRAGQPTDLRAGISCARVFSGCPI
jgi:hypothetical protein